MLLTNAVTISKVTLLTSWNVGHVSAEDKTLLTLPLVLVLRFDGIK